MDIRFSIQGKTMYRMVNAALLSYIGIFTIGRDLGIVSPGALHVAFVLLVISVIMVLQCLSVKGRILSLFGITVFLGIVAAVMGVEQFGLFLISYIKWLGNKPQWKQEWIAGYEIMQTLWVVLVCCLFQYIQEKDFRIKAAGAIFLMGLSVCYLYAGRDLAYGGVVCNICYLIMVLTEWTQRHWNKIKRRSLSVYMLWMIPFLGIYFVLLLIMPVSQTPYDWKLFRNVYESLQESVSGISYRLFQDKNDEPLYLSGFSEEGPLGGGFFSNSKKVMEIEGEAGFYGNVYLIGKVFAGFDGRDWQACEEETPKARYIDTVETLYAVLRYDKEYLNDYIDYSRLIIRYQYMRSDYVFCPLKMLDIEKNGREVPYTEEKGSMFFEAEQDYGTVFFTHFYQMNMGQEGFDDFLEAEKEPDTELLESILASRKTRPSEKITPQDIQEYHQACYDNYLDEVILSEETAAYLEQITQDAETDVEKLRAIERELASYTYSKEPGKLPDTVTDGSAFLDYFLLESRQGYCTHFATAFTLLARAEGIPARYVQGYCVPMNSDAKVTVTSAMAHAWPEVYLEDAGWIPFEPTPGYGKIRYTSWAARKPGSNLYIGNGAGDHTDDQNRSGQYGEPEDPAGGSLLQQAADEEPGRERAARRLRKILQIMGLTVAFGMCCGLFAILIERLSGRYRYAKMDEDQKYLVDVGRNFKILGRLGMYRGDQETLAEFRTRSVSLLQSSVQLRFVEDYEKVLYGNIFADQEMLRLVKEEQMCLLSVLKERKRWSYVWYMVCL